MHISVVMELDLKVPEHDILKIYYYGIWRWRAGGNAVSNMISSKLQGANFVVANTDAQTLQNSNCTTKLQLGV